MKLLTILWLAAAAVPGVAGTPQTAAPISLYAQFQNATTETIVDALHEELEAIMSPMGMRFEWHPLAGVRGNEVAVELAVLTFRGRCNVEGLTARNASPGALGWTHVSDGVILPFSDVDCDRIRGFVQKDLLSINSDDREAVFGRALARVVAHELYHIFANTARHGSCGVGKSAYTVQELLSEDFQFETRESDALRSSKAHELLVRASRAPGLD